MAARLPRRIAMVAMHSSPRQRPGTGDSGGMTVVLRGIATELAARGVQVDLLTRATGQARVTVLEPQVTLRELPAGPAGVIEKDRLADVADDFGEAVAALARDPATGYDLIHAHYWLSGIATLPVALELGVPFVQSFHTIAAMKATAPGQAGAMEARRILDAGEADPDEYPAPDRRAKAEEYLAGWANAVVAASAAEATSLVEQVRAPADRVWVIPPGVDVDLFRPNRADALHDLRAELSIARGVPLLVVAGRVQPFKDQELAILALAELRRSHGWAPVLLIAGEATPGDGDYVQALVARARENGVADRVQFLGALSRERLADLFAAATLTIVPSRSETFGLVALESAASGTPVVAFRGSGLLESVSEGRSGILVDSRDPRAWARAIAALLDDPPALQRLSASARQHALDFTWGASATAMLGLYASLL